MEDNFDIGGGGPPQQDEAHDPDLSRGSTQKYIGLDGKPLGSISIIPGPSGPSYAIACHRHKCSRMVAGSRVPDSNLLEQWLKLAEEDPECTTKEKHLSKFAQTVNLAPTKRELQKLQKK